jgi:hypothetical protein
MTGNDTSDTVETQKSLAPGNPAAKTQFVEPAQSASLDETAGQTLAGIFPASHWEQVGI